MIPGVLKMSKHKYSIYLFGCDIILRIILSFMWGSFYDDDFISDSLCLTRSSNVQANQSVISLLDYIVFAFRRNPNPLSAQLQIKTRETRNEIISTSATSKQQILTSEVLKKFRSRIHFKSQNFLNLAQNKENESGIKIICQFTSIPSAML